jgi:hypothetical protein
MRHHDRQPDRNHTAGNERKVQREVKRDERVTEAKREMERRGPEDEMG